MTGAISGVSAVLCLVIKSVLQPVTPTLLRLHCSLLFRNVEQQCSRLNALECEIKSVWASVDFLSWGLAWVGDKAFSPSPTLQHFNTTKQCHALHNSTLRLEHFNTCPHFQSMPCTRPHWSTLQPSTYTHPRNSTLDFHTGQHSHLSTHLHFLNTFYHTSQALDH